MPRCCPSAAAPSLRPLPLAALGRLRHPLSELTPDTRAPGAPEARRLLERPGPGAPGSPGRGGGVTTWVELATAMGGKSFFKFEFQF